MSQQPHSFSNTRPNSPIPPETLIEAARHDVPPTLADMKNTTEYGAGLPEPDQRVVVYYRLVQELAEKRQHGGTAAEWAIHRLVEQGMLTIRPGFSSTPGVIGRDGAWVMAPLSYTMRDLQSSLVYSTPHLWEWWRERQEERINANPASPVCEAAVGCAAMPDVELPATLDQLRDWLAERVCWLRDWHLAPDPKPLTPGLQADIVQMFRRTSRDFPSDPQHIPKWASQFIWMFSEITAHQAHACLERLGILDAPAWPSPDIEKDMRALIVALDHLAALLSFVAQRLPVVGEVMNVPLKPASKAKAVRHKKTKSRDKWIYQECCKGTPHDVIVAELKRIALQRGWRIVSTKQRIQQIGIEYDQQHGLSLPPPRKNQ